MAITGPDDAPEVAELKDPSLKSPKKKSKKGLVLIPQPSSDPQDPLVILQMNTFLDNVADEILVMVNVEKVQNTMCDLPCCFQLHRQRLSRAACLCDPGSCLRQICVGTLLHCNGPSTPELSPLTSQVSAQTAGVAVGPLFTAPLAIYLGRSSVIFWSLICALGCSIWSALMTGRNDYIPFLVSRIASGVSGALPTVLGSSIIMDTFYLHERGVAFLVYSISVSLGTIGGSTFGGFIVGRQSWTVCFWWPVPLLAIAAGLNFMFLEETHFNRVESGVGSRYPRAFFPNRTATFFPGIKIAQHQSLSTIASSRTRLHFHR